MATPTGELLTRLDERTERIVKDVNDLKSSTKSLEQEIRNGYVSRAEFEAHSSGTVSRDEFKPVQSIVYGIVALFGIGIITAIGALIFRGAAP